MTKPITRKLRCAVYTRKSSEEGLEQEFNSLHAQREACEAYVASQRSEGWALIRESYDDGGFSGGTLERPALKRLLADIEEGLVDVVVVYKIDRLSRSLMDFSKLVEVFERSGVTFVSVTQSFNTTTSMGRLTLNILLSFAQFEREVIVSAGIARSGIMEAAIQRYAPKLSSVRAQLALLVIVVTVLSAFVKNIGALAIMIPIAFQFARRSGVSASVFLMPMAFGSLLGGLMTQIGTSPNIVVSRVRAEITGESFTMFDFTPVGAVLAVVGTIFLILFYWLVPVRNREAGSIHEAINIQNYTTEAEVVEGSVVLGKTVADLLKLSGGDAIVTSILRSQRRISPLPNAIIREGDIIMIEGDPSALDRMVTQGKLSVTGGRDTSQKTGGSIAIEGVIAADSSLIGWSAERLALHERFNVNLLAVSRKGERLRERLGNFTMRLGDVVLLQGSPNALPETLRELGVLPLAERPILLGSLRRGIVPLLILGTAMTMTTFGAVPVSIAFFGAAVTMVLFGVIPLRDVYASMDGPILVMLAALIPVSDSLRRTGATDVLAGGLAEFGATLPSSAGLALVLIVAMAVTPFLNNAATVLVVAPIAAGFAETLGYRPEAFLMAVAIGAGCDFLTPIGHQCNTLIMGPGGYRFGDYPRLGLPLSILVLITAVPMLMLVWPLR